VCLGAPGCGEKALKGLLVARDIDPPRLHDLDRLVALLPDADAAAFERLDLPELTRWAIEGRYPADLDEVTPSDVTRAVELARTVLAEARSRVR
jgi:HEPN domain-containing protein